MVAESEVVGGERLQIVQSFTCRIHQEGKVFVSCCIHIAKSQLVISETKKKVITMMPRKSPPSVGNLEKIKSNNSSFIFYFGILKEDLNKIFS